MSPNFTSPLEDAPPREREGLERLLKSGSF